MHRQRAAGTAQTGQGSTHVNGCQTSDTMEVPPHMLRFLRIRNLAVIESVEVEFDQGFNVLTGETGAGKSILVEAVGLLLGARATSDLVRTGESLASIEAVFEEPGGEELLIRREITSPGSEPLVRQWRTGHCWCSCATCLRRTR